MHRARLIFQDGAERTVEVEAGQTVLEGALAVDLPVRYDCCTGSCGSCVVQCLDGQTVVDLTGKVPVNADELMAGLRPACLTRLNSDASFELPYPLGSARLRALETFRADRGAASWRAVGGAADPQARSRGRLRFPERPIHPPRRARRRRSARVFHRRARRRELPLIELMIRLRS